MSVRVLAVGNLYPPAATGGYERIWVSTVEALRARGHEVRVLTSDAPPAGPEIEPGVLRDLRWYSRGGRWIRAGRVRAGRIERHDLAVLREHLGWADVVSWWGMGGLPLALLQEPAAAGVPAVGVVGDGWMVYGFEADPRARPFDLGACARWLFISRAAEERALREGHDLPRRGLVHPGVDAARFRERPVRPWDWRLTLIGRIAEGKGVEVAVAALDSLPEATLTIDGPGTLHDVHERVRVARTPSDRVADAYAAADAVLFPVTWPEPWGLVPLEGMSVGRPVIATGTGGSGEYLEHERNALLVAPGDPDALAAAVRRLAGDPDLRARLRAGGLETARTYTAAAFEAAVVAALEEEAGARTRGA
jgi:glycosyltransferase involved in cell wall biosynthesis